MHQLITIQLLLITEVLLVVSFTFHSKHYKNSIHNVNSCSLINTNNCNRARRRSFIQNKANDDDNSEKEEAGFLPNELFSVLLKNLFPSVNSKVWEGSSSISSISSSDNLSIQNEKDNNDNNIDELKDIWSFLSSKYVNTQQSSSTALIDGISLLNVDSLLTFMEDSNSNSSDSIVVSKSNNMNELTNNTAKITTETLENVIFFNNWEFFIYTLQEAMQQASKSITTQSNSNSIQLDDLLRDTVTRFEGLVQDLSYVSSPVNTVLTQLNNITSASTPTILKYTNDQVGQVLSFVNTVLSYGYYSNEPELSNTALFSEYSGISNTSQEFLERGSRYASLSANVYHPERWRSEVLTNDYSIVGNGTVSDVMYLVTDSIEDGELTRTITVKGYDATDGSIDRERLLRNVITAYPESITIGNTDFEVHSGLLSIAKSMYTELMDSYVDTLGSSHKLVLCGHSIGGSLSILIMMLMVQDRGADFVKDKIGKVFAYGAPPIVQMPLLDTVTENDCPILTTLGLPSDLVLSFIQPLDPIARLFTIYDPLYPLVDDIGEDGVTPYVNGPPRTLRPVVKALVEIWPSWSSFREPLKEHLYQDFIPVGSFYLLLPEPTRYITDRLISLDISVPPLETVLSIPMNGRRFLYFLNQFFPLTTLRVSTVPVALRSFIHHFYPAYNSTLNDFVDASKNKKTITKKAANAVRKEDNNNNNNDERPSFSFPVVENDDLQSNINYLLATTSSLAESIPNNLDLARWLRMALQQNTNTTINSNITTTDLNNDQYDSTETTMSSKSNRVVEYSSIGKEGIIPQIVTNIVAIFVASFVKYVIIPFQE